VEAVQIVNFGQGMSAPVPVAYLKSEIILTLLYREHHYHTTTISTFLPTLIQPRIFYVYTILPLFSCQTEYGY